MSTHTYYNQYLVTTQQIKVCHIIHLTNEIKNNIFDLGI